MAEGIGSGMNFVGSRRWAGVVSIGLFGNDGGLGYGWVDSRDRCGFFAIYLGWIRGLGVTGWAWWLFWGGLTVSLGVQDLDRMEWILWCFLAAEWF